MEEDEDQFAAIVRNIESLDDRSYRRRAVAASLALLLGATTAGLCWVVWATGWGAVVGLPLMAGADIALFLALRRLRRWRRPIERRSASRSRRRTTLRWWR